VEPHRVPGVAYALTDDGLELPVVDVTHPAFDCELSEEALSAAMDASMRSAQLALVAPPAQLDALAQQSLLFRVTREAAGTFLTGMGTYLTRLRPDLLGAWASDLDRRVAAGIMPVSFRYRLRDMARLLAEALATGLEARPEGAVHLLNIGGGPASDSLNALILVRKERPALLQGRPIAIHLLDLDDAGPRFGARSLAALQEAGAPLEGVDATLHHMSYDWTDAAPLRRFLTSLGEEGVVAGSTEGALFDYAADGDIAANLTVLRDRTPAEFVLVGSVPRGARTLDPRMAAMEDVPGRPDIRYLGLDAFLPLVRGAGWKVSRTLDSVAHHVVALVKA
jgi:hypothetical protein